MHGLIAFFALLFSTPHAPVVRCNRFLESPGKAIPLNELAPSRVEIAQLRAGSVYAGRGCLSCRRTKFTSNGR